MRCYAISSLLVLEGCCLRRSVAGDNSAITWIEGHPGRYRFQVQVEKSEMKEVGQSGDESFIGMEETRLQLASHIHEAPRGKLLRRIVE
jgi:hypothetical protein